MKIVIFIVDSLRAANLGCYGYGKNTSPNVDAIAGENILFKNAISQSNWTYPSLYSMISGKYPSKIDMTFFDLKINESLKVLPEFLSEKGFHTTLFSYFRNLINTAAFGSHFDDTVYVELNDDAVNMFRKWTEKKGDSFLIFHIGEYTHEPYFAEKEYVSGFLDRDIDPEDPEVVNKTVKILTDRQTETSDSTLHDINRSINLRRLRLNEKQLKYLIAAYDAGIYRIDGYIGKMYEIIKHAETDRIFMVTGDHGQAFMEHGFFGHGIHLYDEVGRVPLICDINGGFNRIVTAPVQLLDIYSTVAEFLNLQPPHRLDGRSLLSHLTSRENHDHYAISEAYPFISIRKGKYKLISSFLKFQQRMEVLKTLAMSVKNGSKRQILYNLYAYLSFDKLYDIENDPGERRNLRFRKREIYKMLRGQLGSHINETKNEKFPPRGIELAEDIKKQLENLGYM